MKFEFDHKTGTMRPKKDEKIYFAQSQGGGLIVDDKKHNIKYIIERDENITKLFGNFDKDNLNLYDMRDARIISDRVIRLFGRNHKYSDFHYFLRGYHMNESVIESCSDFLNESVWGGMLDRSVGDSIRKEEVITYDTLEDEDCTVDVLYKYLIQNYELLGDEQIKLNIGKNKGEYWYEVHIPITLSGENIETELCADEYTKIWSIDFTVNLKKYVEKMNTVEEIDDELMNSDDYFRAYTGSSPLLCSEVIDFLDEILTLVPDPAVKKKIINESVWGGMLDRSVGDSIKKEDGRIIGTLEDGTKLIISNEAFGDGELVHFDGNNIYTFNESGDEPIYVAVITDENTDVYYKYDEDSEDIVNMVRCFDADESLRTNNDFGMLRALMNQDEWDNSCIDDLEVSNEGNYVKFEFSGFEFKIYDDIDKAKDDAVEDAIEIEKESLKVLKNELSQKYLSSTELEKIRKRFHNFIDNIRNNCGSDGFDEDELKDVFEESFGFDYDEFDEDDAIEALLSKEIIEETEEYFGLDEDGEIDHSLPKFDYQDYKDKYVEKSLEDLGDFIDEYISRFGYDGIEEYIDFDKVGEIYVDIDGPGHWLGDDREQRIDYVTYYIYKRD